MANNDTNPTVFYISSGDRVVCAVEQVVCVTYLCFPEGTWQYGEVCVFTSTLCKYNLKKGDLLVLSWARVRRVCLGRRYPA